jgi:hypothetical protein
MYNAIREYQTVDKSALCLVYDTILEPLNIVCGMRKVVQLPTGAWEKQDRTKNFALFAIAAVATAIFSTLILAALILKGKNSEHRLRTMDYQVFKQEAYLLKQGYNIGYISRDENTFSIELEARASTVTFNWYGRRLSG